MELKNNVLKNLKQFQTQMEYAFQQFAYWKSQNSMKIILHFNEVAFYSQSKYGMSAERADAEFTLLKAPPL